MRIKKSPRRLVAPAGERADEIDTNKTDVILSQIKQKINRGREF